MDDKLAELLTKSYKLDQQKPSDGMLYGNAPSKPWQMYSQESPAQVEPQVGFGNYVMNALARLKDSMQGPTDRMKMSGNWYNPADDSVVVQKTGPQSMRNSLQMHESEHQRQFKTPNQLFNPESEQIARRISNTLRDNGANISYYENQGYAGYDIPFELLAELAETNKNSWPPRGFSKLSDEDKLWLIRQREAYLTHQPYLQDPKAIGEKYRIRRF